MLFGPPPVILVSYLEKVDRASMSESDRVLGDAVEDEAKMVDPRPPTALGEIADDKNRGRDAMFSQHRNCQRRDIVVADIQCHRGRVGSHHPQTELVRQLMQRHHAETRGQVLHVLRKSPDREPSWVSPTILEETVKEENQRLLSARELQQPKQPGM